MNEMSLMLSRNGPPGHTIASIAVSRPQALAESYMFAITGITGQVGGAVARTLLAAGKNVRAVVRDAKKGAAWARQGCEVALADLSDTTALTKAFTATEGVLILLPPNFDPEPDFPEERAILRAVHAALIEARPQRVVSISTVGAQATRQNLLPQHTLH